ncbi:MAG: hypothetical protein WCL06_02725 [Bacteroidota bacterium]
MKHNQHIRINHVLMTACGSLFVVLLLILSYYNRFAVDDYYHIHVVTQKGITAAALDGYYNYGGRWTSYFLWGLVYYFYNVPLFTALYSFLVFLLFALAVWLLLRNIFRTTGLSSSYTYLPVYSVLLTAAFFFACESKGEIWFWVVSTTMYLNSLTAFIFVLSLLLSSRGNIGVYLLLAGFGIFAGGAAETYAVVFLGGLTLLLILKFSVKSEIFKRISTGKLITVIVFIAAAFCISVFASGNSVRAGWLPERSFTGTFLTTLVSLKDLVFHKLIYAIPYILLFSFPWLAAGQLLSTGNIKMSLRKFILRFIISGTVLWVVSYMIMFPTCYLLSEVCPDRAISVVILLIVIFAATWSFLVGYYRNISLNTERYAQKIVLILMAGFLIYAIISQYNRVSDYGIAVDQRMEYLRHTHFQDKNHIEYLQPLPPSGFLYSAEISADTGNYKNVQLRMGAFIEYALAVKAH